MCVCVCVRARLRRCCCCFLILLLIQHIFVGYVFLGAMIVTTSLFLVFFGLVCTAFQAGTDPADLCATFQAEIWATGLTIFLVTLLIGISAAFRNRIRYAVFFGLHMLVFAMYALAMAHTFDDKARAGQTRSQVFPWVTAPLLLYFADRAYRHFTTRHNLLLLDAGVASKGAFLTLRFYRPSDFTFQPGQYACLQCPSLGTLYHPFSIGSSPDDQELLFYIEVMGSGSWTARLRDNLQRGSVAARSLKFNLQGPFGVPTAGSSYAYQDAIVACSTGTGVVPMLSLFEHRVQELQRVHRQAGLTGTRRAAAALQGAAHYHEELISAQRVDEQQQQKQVPQHKEEEEEKDNPVFHGAAIELEHGNMATTISLQILQLRYRLRSLRRHGHKAPYYRKITRHHRIGGGPFGWLLGINNSSRTILCKMGFLAAFFLEFSTTSLYASWSVLLLSYQTAVRDATLSAAAGAGNNSTKLMADLTAAGSSIIDTSPTQAMMDTTLILTAALTFFYIVTIARRARVAWHRNAWLVVEFLLGGCMVTMLVYWWVQADFVNPTDGRILLMVLFGAFRARTFLIAGVNPGGSRYGHGKRHMPESFDFIWSTRSHELALGILPQLILRIGQVQRNWNSSSGNSSAVEAAADTSKSSQQRRELRRSILDQQRYIARYLGVRVHVTSRDAVGCNAVRDLIRGTCLEDRVFFKRPDFQKFMLDHTRASIIKGIDTTTTAADHVMVAFCGGNKALRSCMRAVEAAGALTSLLRLSNFQFTFVAEEYGYTGKGSGRNGRLKNDVVADSLAPPKKRSKLLSFWRRSSSITPSERDVALASFSSPGAPLETVEIESQSQRQERLTQLMQVSNITVRPRRTTLVQVSE